MNRFFPNWFYGKRRTDWALYAGIGLGIGFTTGVGLGLILAPKSGYETRRLLKDRAQRLTSKVKAQSEYLVNPSSYNKDITS